MTDLESPDPDGILSRALEEQAYDAAAKEVEGGVRRDGLWAKAFANSEGDESRAKALYLKYRAQSLLDEAFVRLAQMDSGPTGVHERIRELTRLLDAEINTWEDLYLEAEADRDALQEQLNNLLSGDLSTGIIICTDCRQPTADDSRVCPLCRHRSR